MIYCEMNVWVGMLQFFVPDLFFCVKWWHTRVNTYFSSERFLQNHHFVQDAAQCPDVGSLVVRLTFTEFRCQVARCSEHGQKLCLPAACDNTYYCITVCVEMKFDCLRRQWRKVWWAGFAACMGEKRSVYRVFFLGGGNLKERHHIEDGSIILKWIWRSCDLASW